VTAPAPLGVAGIIADTARLTAAAFGRLFPVAYVPALASAAVAGVAAPDPTLQVTAGQLWAGVIDLVLGTLVSGVLCLAALDARFGTRHGVGEYLRQSLRHLLPLLVFGLLLSIAMVIGVMLLVVPGLYVAARYLPYVPATVFEDRGWEGTSRAEELTLGYRWPLVGTVLVFGLLFGGVLLVIGLPAAAAAEGLGTMPAIRFGAALTALAYVVFATFSAVVYLRLRALRDGLTPAEVAAATIG
jgi:hypothetical protein